jgi:methionine synthase I (cobalamin-dependent)
VSNLDRQPERFRAALACGPLVLDGAMGTRLVARGLNLADDDPAFWNLVRPEAVAGIHGRDVAAGSDAVLSNTFGANRNWLARFGRNGDVAAINHRAVALARGAAGPDRFVLGSIGPTAAGPPDGYCEQAELLAAAGADALLFETHLAPQAVVALERVSRLTRLPLLVSLHEWPEDLAETARRLADLGAEVLGANCQDGMEPALQTAEQLSAVVRLPLLIKPNAGLPGTTPVGPELFARALPRLLALGVRLIGGCCGTTEAHVAAICAACYDASSASKAVRNHGSPY